jgi:hypothetical protein
MVRDRDASAPPPFSGTVQPATFHTTAAHDEALARLEWLVDQRQRCGLVVAEAGMGKSHLAVAAARRLGGLGAEVAVLSLAGLPDGEWLDLLLDRLPLDPASRAEPLRPWLKLENRLRENTLLGRATVLVCDDIDRGPADAREGLARLVAAAEPRFGTTIVVVTAAPAGLGLVPACLERRRRSRLPRRRPGAGRPAARTLFFRRRGDDRAVRQRRAGGDPPPRASVPRRGRGRRSRAGRGGRDRGNLARTVATGVAGDAS